MEVQKEEGAEVTQDKPSCTLWWYMRARLDRALQHTSHLYKPSVAHMLALQMLLCKHVFDVCLWYGFTCPNSILQMLHSSIWGLRYWSADEHGSWEIRAVSLVVMGFFFVCLFGNCQISDVVFVNLANLSWYVFVKMSNLWFSDCEADKSMMS